MEAAPQGVTGGCYVIDPQELESVQKMSQGQWRVYVATALKALQERQERHEQERRRFPWPLAGSGLANVGQALYMLKNLFI